MEHQRTLSTLAILIVSVIWASSFVFIKMGLVYLSPLTLAGLRYFAAFLILLPWLIFHNRRNGESAPGYWIKLLVMGLLAYPMGNGLLYWALSFVPATTAAFVFHLTPIPVLLLGILFLREVPTAWQFAGIATVTAGMILFFSPGLSVGQPIGIAALTLGLGAFAIFGIMGRSAAKSNRVGTIPLTAIPLGFGGAVLLLIAFFAEGMPSLTFEGIEIVLWLAVVNTVLAYLLYNKSLRVLPAFEVNVILNISPLITALMASVLLAEQITFVQVVGMVSVIAGVVLVQWKAREGIANIGD